MNSENIGKNDKKMTRRQFLKFGAIAAGGLTASALVGCGNNESDGQSPHSDFNNNPSNETTGENELIETIIPDILSDNIKPTTEAKPGELFTPAEFPYFSYVYPKGNYTGVRIDSNAKEYYNFTTVFETDNKDSLRFTYTNWRCWSAEGREKLMQVNLNTGGTIAHEEILPDGDLLREWNDRRLEIAEPAFMFHIERWPADNNISGQLSIGGGDKDESIALSKKAIAIDLIKSVIGPTFTSQESRQRQLDDGVTTIEDYEEFLVTGH